MSTRDAYVEKLKAQLDVWNAELAKLEARKSKVEADARVALDRHVAELERHRDEMRGKLSDVEAASDAAWKDMQRGFETAWNSMNKAFNDALSRFR